MDSPSLPLHLHAQWSDLGLTSWILRLVSEVALFRGNESLETPTHNQA